MLLGTVYGPLVWLCQHVPGMDDAINDYCRPWDGDR
jgi:hypothetical protein